MSISPHQFQPLVGGQKFVFVPEDVGGVTDEFVRLFAAKARGPRPAPFPAASGIWVPSWPFGRPT